MIWRENRYYLLSEENTPEFYLNSGIMAEPTKTELAEEITLDESLEDAREAIDKFLNNKFEEAYEIVEPKVIY